MTEKIHPFDQALALTANTDGSFQGEITPAYANMVGPFGGVVSAAMLKAVTTHTQAVGVPGALTVNFVAPIAEAPFQITTRLVKTNRTNQHWLVELSQQGEIACTATVLMVVKREVWSDQELRMPSVAPAEELEAFQFPMGPTWLKQYEFKFINGALTLSGQALADSESMVWVRDAVSRPLDYLSLAACSDVFFPRSFVKTQTFGMAGTVSLTTYFHADEASLAEQGTDSILGVARGQRFAHGYFDQSAELWSKTGELLATSMQLVYYK